MQQTNALAIWKKYFSYGVVIGLITVTLSIVTASALLNSIPESESIADQVTDTIEVTFRSAPAVDNNNNDCTQFEWIVDGDADVLFMTEPVTSSGSELICYSYHSITLQINTFEDVSKTYTIGLSPLKHTIYQLVSFLFITGLIITVAGIIALLMLRPQDEDMTHAELTRLFATIAGILLTGIVLRVYGFYSNSSGFNYESLDWLSVHVFPAFLYVRDQLPIFASHILVSFPADTLNFILRDAFHTRAGAGISLTGMLAGLIPYDFTPDKFGQLITLTHYSLDLISAMFVIVIFRYVKFPNYVGLIAALIMVTFVPFAIESATILREPVSRFSFLLLITGYVIALYDNDTRMMIAGITIGSIGTILLGFASTPNHLAYWLITITVIGLFFLSGENRWYRTGIQLIFVLGLVVFLQRFSYAVSDIEERPASEVFAVMMTGMEQDGVITDLTTVVTCDVIWCSEFEVFMVDETISDSIADQPVEFVSRYLYSMYGTLTGVSNTYHDRLILTVGQQKSLHLLILFAGVFGIAWLSGNIARHWKLIALIGIPAAYFVLIFSLNGIETRRLSTVYHIFIFGTAIYFHSLRLIYVKRPIFTLILIGSLLVAGLIGSLQFDLFTGLLPIQIVATLITILRVTTLLCVISVHVYIWKRIDDTFNRWIAFIFLSLMAVILMSGDMNEHPEYEWRARISDGVTQTIQELPAGQDYYLLLDLESNDVASDISIEVNGRVLKPSGVAMTPFDSGVDSTVTTHVMDFTYPNLRTYYRVELPADYLTETTERGLTRIILRASDGYIYGSFPVEDETYYVPGYQPAVDLSFARLLYTHLDYRIERRVQITDMESNRITDENESIPDLSSSYGFQHGIYHIFVVPADTANSNNTRQ